MARQFPIEETIMMPSEAAMCKMPGKLFTGLCFRRNNCATICEKEGFLFGVCKGLKCACAKDCNAGGGGGGRNPGQGPPGEGPPGGEGPPDEGGEGPPGSEGPPEEGPPGGQEPPVLNRESSLLKS